MKNLYPLLVISIIFSACKDEDQQPASISILGSWESIEWKDLYSSGYWTSFPNGQKVITYNSSETEDFWLDLIFLSDGDVLGIDEDGFSMLGSWAKNGNSLIIDDNNFTITTLSASSLTVYSTE